MTEALGVLACLTWLYLLVGRGGFWRVQSRDGEARTAPQAHEAPAGLPSDTQWPSVVAIVPARDEAPVIAGAVTSLLRQRYAGPLSVVLVDDASSDETAENARRAAMSSHAECRLAIVPATPTPPGWTGKLWALACGVGHVESMSCAPDYLLLTDADIVHAPESLSALVTEARAERLALDSRMARLHCESAVERAFVPAFVFFFRMLYPFAWVNRPRSRTAAAAGGCMLVERGALSRAGGLASVRGELIDDCALARALKRQGPIRLALTDHVRSVRRYLALDDVRRMIARTAYAQLRFSPLLLALTALAMAVTFIAPPVLAIVGSGIARLLGAAAWIAMALAFQPSLRFYRVSPLWGLAVPVIAGFYLAFTLDSAYQSARGRTGLWKGRVYGAPRSLR